MWDTEVGVPNPGAIICEDSINFAIYAKNKNKVKLNIYKSSTDVSPEKVFCLDPTVNKTGDVWHISIKGLKEGICYTWTLDDSTEILDPYALSYTGETKTKDKKSVAVKSAFKGSVHPNTPLEDTIIYECQVRSFTMGHSSGVVYPGTYTSLVEKIDHFKYLGITSVELLPVYEWDDAVAFTNREGTPLRNIWGYNPIGFFAPSKKLAKDKSIDNFNEIEEFRKMVDKFHENDIEVILDVVYNHTAEGGQAGPTYNFKAMGPETYYMLEHDNINYMNYSGCGNTLNCNDQTVRGMIIDSLRYWYTEMGVDGFRFDLASVLGRDSRGQWVTPSILDEISQDPILNKAKLISESWDTAGYFLGDMPVGWSEWNGKYRDAVRRFIRGDYEQIPELLKRIFGSPDIFKRENKTPHNSINFITSHDGFTIRDLVSYNDKHNRRNGENNRDGDNNSFSYNWGDEGITSDTKLRSTRKKMIKNMFLILMISQGVPMIHMGDEMGNTQYGNNNAYCQDNEVSYLDWDKTYKEFSDIMLFVKNMISLRKKYKIFRKKDYLVADDTSEERDEVSLHGVKLGSPDFASSSLSIAFTLMDIDTDTRFHVMLSAYHGYLTFELPATEKDRGWKVLVDTSHKDDLNFTDTDEIISGSYVLSPNTCAILIDEGKKR